MRKALAYSAVALASAMALAAPVAASAAEAPVAPAPVTSTDHGKGSDKGTGDDTHASAASLRLSVSSAKPGDSVKVTVNAPKGSTNLSVSSAALGDVKLSPAGDGVWTGTATVAKVADGNYGASLTGSAPDGTKLQATAQLSVKAGTPTPAPSEDSVSLSTDFGHAGDHVKITIKTNKTSAFVDSKAFAGGRVNLTLASKGVWTGTATVAKDVTSGYYGVDAYAGGKKFDTVKFSTEATGPDHKGHDKKVVPVNPKDHKTPKGSVNTGMAPVGYVPEGR
ncbi:hypothetical protein ACN20G_10320 [Streptomyces sp. BI20]|uniref:hypothetical protein n=1 Tax=Streptomyces sp. BI20 TaxID=3403460 RepID=UPI003C7599A5